MVDFHKKMANVISEDKVRDVVSDLVHIAYDRIGKDQPEEDKKMFGSMVGQAVWDTEDGLLVEVQCSLEHTAEPNYIQHHFMLGANIVHSNGSVVMTNQLHNDRYKYDDDDGRRDFIDTLTSTIMRPPRHREVPPNKNAIPFELPPHNTKKESGADEQE